MYDYFIALRFFILSIVLYYFNVVNTILVLEGKKLFIDYNADSRTTNILVFVNNRRNGEYMDNFFILYDKKGCKIFIFSELMSRSEIISNLFEETCTL